MQAHRRRKLDKSYSQPEGCLFRFLPYLCGRPFGSRRGRQAGSPALAGEAVGLWPLRLVKGEGRLGLGGEEAEGERGLVAIDRLHCLGLVSGEAGEEGLASLTAGEGVAEEGEGVFGIHRVCLVHLRQ